MYEQIEEKFAECLDMASDARHKAETARSPEDERFWLRMEQRWLYIAKTYRETEQLVHVWLRPPNGHATARN